MINPTKIILLVLGIILGILLAFGASNFEIIFKNKTDELKDFLNLVAKSTSIVSVSIFVLTVLKKIRIRPTWSYFVMGVAATYSIMTIVILPLLS
ncbi:hypothetical protein [Nitrosarchaeum koreense]|uniref:Uncharacterized protein n=1 Tax=Nitrosarchaeum koreense MY1 TaxID=1001994 RepID=F9CWF8_9ARCH|nr:hypothetical protein [Nitrosarchaeum koreense]EGP93610.1 hypothetical protein MY1_0848 [Nitrosarchaeum koreense MY1]